MCIRDRSLAVEPEIWFLDEPFSALDPLIRREMQTELLRLQSVLKKTIVFITHDFDEAIRLADRIAIMKDGRIIQIGTAEDLVMNPATAYVAEFTSDVNRAKVLSCLLYTSTVRLTGARACRSRIILGVRKCQHYGIGNPRHLPLRPLLRLPLRHYPLQPRIRPIRSRSRCLTGPALTLSLIHI